MILYKLAANSLEIERDIIALLLSLGFRTAPSPSSLDARKPFKVQLEVAPVED